MKQANKSEHNPEYGVDSRYNSKSEKLSDGKRLLEARLNRLNNLSENQIIQAKLLQLKYQMEAYLTQPINTVGNSFTNFLTKYIDIIYDKRMMFAKDINITPVSLSQILNSHREPKEEILLRLMIHSEITYKSICKFQKEIWYQVYYHEKICETMASQEEWEPKEQKHVKIKYALLK